MAYGGSQHVNRVLQNISMKYQNNEYIADKVLKTLSVVKESDLINVFARDFRLNDTLRQNRSRSNMVSYGVSTTSYTLNEHALSDVVTDRDRQNSDLNPDIDTTEFLTDKILMTQEKEVADLLFTTTTWGNSTTLTTATSWAYNTTTSAPIQNVLSATGVIIANSGKMPNTGVLGWKVFEALKENPNVYGRIQYVERAIITEQLLAAVFDLDNVYVGKAIYDASKEGDPAGQNTAIAETPTFIWDSNALICYINPVIGKKQVTAAVNIKATSGGIPYKVKKWRDEGLAGDIIEVSTMMSPKALATNCGYYFLSCTNV